MGHFDYCCRDIWRSGAPGNKFIRKIANSFLFQKNPGFHPEEECCGKTPKPPGTVGCPDGTSDYNNIPNPSWELRDCNPSSFSQVNCATDWIQASGATSDYHTSDFYHFPNLDQEPQLFPFPDGTGIMGGFVVKDFPGQGESYVEMIGTCLSTPLLAGQDYYFNFMMCSVPASGGNGGSGGLTPNDIWYGDIDMTLYGHADCASLPFYGEGVNGFGSPKATDGWVVLGSNVYTPTKTWEPVTIHIKPTVDIRAFVIGGPSYNNIPSDYLLSNIPAGTFQLPYIFYDALKFCKQD